MKIAASAACSICFAVAVLHAAARPPAPPSEGRDTDPVVQELCGKSVALLGESPVHGFGKTLEFKATLVRRLVDECHFNALFVESGIYDFINIQKKLKAGQDVPDSMIWAAIGGLWATKEMQPLIPFLRDRMKTGTLTLAGLDDQISRGTYAQREMAADLVQHLQGDERSRCLAIFQKYMLWQYTDASPYSPAENARITGCLDQIAATGDDRAMVDSLKRFFVRNLAEEFSKSADPDAGWNGRDQSMFVNFQWLRSQLPRQSKIIVWCATVHAAKSLAGAKGFERRVPLGSYISRELLDRAFALGFSAYSGSYAFTGQPVQQLSAAPETSMEARTFANRDADSAYLSLEQLRKFGPVEARPLGTTFTTARWDDVMDGLVVFREERAPEYLRH